MEFRSATENDASSIHNLFKKCWNISYRDILSEEVRSNMSDEKVAALWMNALATNATRETIVGTEDKLIVGFFRIGQDKENENRGHIFSLYVSPELSGHGYGKLLLSEAINNLLGRNFREISLWVFKENSIAQSLYSQFGFEPTGSERVTAAWGAVEIEMLKTVINPKS